MLILCYVYIYFVPHWKWVQHPFLNVFEGLVSLAFHIQILIVPITLVHRTLSFLHHQSFHLLHFQGSLSFHLFNHKKRRKGREERRGITSLFPVDLLFLPHFNLNCWWVPAIAFQIPSRFNITGLPHASSVFLNHLGIHINFEVCVCVCFFKESDQLLKKVLRISALLLSRKVGGGEETRSQNWWILGFQNNNNNTNTYIYIHECLSVDSFEE